MIMNRWNEEFECMGLNGNFDFTCARGEVRGRFDEFVIDVEKRWWRCYYEASGAVNGEVGLGVSACYAVRDIVYELR
jgi:hypothetical protein